MERPTTYQLTSIFKKHHTEFQKTAAVNYLEYMHGESSAFVPALVSSFISFPWDEVFLQFIKSHVETWV